MSLAKIEALFSEKDLIEDGTRQRTAEDEETTRRPTRTYFWSRLCCRNETGGSYSAGPPGLGAA